MAEKTWTVRCDAVDVTHDVKAPTRAAAKYISWRMARDAGYKLSFGDFRVKLATPGTPEAMGVERD